MKLAQWLQLRHAPADAHSFMLDKAQQKWRSSSQSDLPLDGVESNATLSNGSVCSNRVYPVQKQAIDMEALRPASRHIFTMCLRSIEIEIAGAGQTVRRVQKGQISFGCILQRNNAGVCGQSPSKTTVSSP